MAVIGGGASGLAAAWLLDASHEVHLFEREEVLGGHIRTVGGNVECSSLPPGVQLDAGVIEFDREDFPAFHAWMQAVGVTVRPLPDGGFTNLFLADGRHYHSPGGLAAEHPRLVERLQGLVQLTPLMLRLRRFRERTAVCDENSPWSMDHFLSEDDFSVWIRCLLMYAYSMHYDEVRGLSAALAVPMLRSFLESNAWTCIPGGVSSYVDAVARSLRGSVHLATEVKVLRQPEGVLVRRDGSEQRFDQVVLAVPPHRVLSVLADADEAERAWFGAHQGHTIYTLLHTDFGPYRRRGVHAPSEFDLFELPGGGHGYNAYLNRLAGLPDPGPVAYGLAFDMGAEIDPSLVLHRQPHEVGLYTDSALLSRPDVLSHNGRHNTWYAGAWLGDGLHEGAVQSALAVSEALGGRTLAGISSTTRPR